MAADSSDERLPELPQCREMATDRLVDVKIIMKVARYIGNKWKWLGRQMDVEEAKLNNIEVRYKDQDEQAYQMLLVWKEVASDKATVNELAQMLREVRREDLASEVLRMAAEETPKPTTPQTPPLPQDGERSLHREDYFNIITNVLTEAMWPGQRNPRF